MSILIGADIVPCEVNKKYFSSGEMLSILGADLINLLNSVDYRIFNLECPLVDRCSPIKKCGPTLKADVSAVSGLKSIDVNLLTLANNHIMDHGFEGLESTIKNLDKKKISFLGAGRNLGEASKTYSFVLNDKKIGVYACAEHEFSIARENDPGANPFDPLESFDHVDSLSSQNDFTIVLYHGGKENYRYPSPSLQKICHKFIEKGAGLIVCQHSHCIGCEEKYLNGTIIYGQGNFIFSDCDAPTEQTSILIKLNDDFSIEYFPLVKTTIGVRLASENAAKRIMADFYGRSKQILKENFIEQEYKRFAEKMIETYLLSGKFILRVLNKLTMHRLSVFYKKIFSKRELLVLQNYIECEAHRELWIEGIKELLRR